MLRLKSFVAAAQDDDVRFFLGDTKDAEMAVVITPRTPFGMACFFFAELRGAQDPPFGDLE